MAGMAVWDGILFQAAVYGLLLVGLGWSGMEVAYIMVCGWIGV